jgi:hypothetical protein
MSLKRGGQFASRIPGHPVGLYSPTLSVSHLNPNPGMFDSPVAPNTVCLSIPSYIQPLRPKA